MKFAIPLVGVAQNYDERGVNKNNKRSSEEEDVHTLANFNSSSTRTTRCDGCGYIGHCPDKTNCVYKDHPGFNTERVSWEKSTNGKAYADPNIMPAKPGASVASGCKHLIFTHSPDGTALSTEEMARLRRHFTSSDSPHKRGGGKNPRR
jgi:hypothetical protein